VCVAVFVYVGVCSCMVAHSDDGMGDGMVRREVGVPDTDGMVVKRLVRQVVSKYSADSSLAGAGLWMEAVGWKADGSVKDECKKQAKSLLKRQQGNMHLWVCSCLLYFWSMCVLRRQGG